MNLEQDLIQLINQSTNKEDAILAAMEVIHAELERLLSEPVSQPSNRPEGA